LRPMVAKNATPQADDRGSGRASRIVLRGLTILEHLANSRDGLSVAQLASLIGLHRSSVYRYLSALMEQGYVVRSEEGCYALGPRVLELATIVLERIDVRQVARAALIRLCEETEATVHLSQLNGSEVVYLDKVESSRTLPLHSRIGGRAPSYCTGVGKALLAHLHPERLERILGRLELTALTDNTIVAPEELRRELSKVRNAGYAVDRGEHEEGIHCVAAPVFDYKGDVVVAVSATDIKRKIQGNEDWYARMVQRTAEDVSQRLGYRGRK